MYENYWDGTHKKERTGHPSANEFTFQVKKELILRSARAVVSLSDLPQIAGFPRQKLQLQTLWSYHCTQNYGQQEICLDHLPQHPCMPSEGMSLAVRK